MRYGYRILDAGMLRPIQPLDLAFLWIDRPETPSNVGALLLLDPPAGADAARLARQVVRAYRSARPTSPFDGIPDLPLLGLPQWRTVERVDLRRHVSLEQLDPPGDHAQLHRLVARLHESQLDRTRPLFALHVIHGLSDGRFAVYFKSHHACWDGRYALERVFGSLTREPGPIAPPFFAVRDPGAVSGTSAAGLAGSVRALLAQAAGFRELFATLAGRTRTAVASRRRSGNRPFAGPHTRFNDAVHPGRSFAGFELPLAELREVAHAAGGTVNDAVLAIVDAGVTRYLAGLGERPRRPLVAMCPVSLREPGDHEATTKAATLFVPLGGPRAGPAARLRRIVAATRAAKGEFHGFSHEAMQDYAALAFGLWFASSALGLGAVTRPVVNLTVSNVGAIDGPRYLGRSRLVAAYPVSMIAEPVGLNVTTVSLDGRMEFGVIAASGLADAARIAADCEAAFAELCRPASGAASPAAATTRRRAAAQDLTLRKPPERSPSRRRRMPASQRS
jgi:WS/DGAT/MGAT family acyltransferase